MRTRDVIATIKDAATSFSDHKATRLAASLAFYTMLSLAPLLVIVIAVASLVFGQQAAQGEVVAQIEHTVGRQGAEAIQAMLAASRDRLSGVVAMIIGAVVFVVGASGVFAELQDSLNTVWGVMPKPGRGIVGVVRARFLSFAMVLGLGGILLVLLVVSAGLSVVDRYLDRSSPFVAIGAHVGHELVSFGVVTIAAAMIFKVLPDAKIDWRDVWLGSAATALLFTLGKLAIGFYLGRSSVSSTYGAAGSFVVLLLWTYYSAQILFFGAEITRVVAKRNGAAIRPGDDAMAMTCEDDVKQGIARSDQLAHGIRAHVRKPLEG